MSELLANKFIVKKFLALPNYEFQKMELPCRLIFSLVQQIYGFHVVCHKLAQEQIKPFTKDILNFDIQSTNLLTKPYTCTFHSLK
jgi:hypothetical protein